MSSVVADTKSECQDSVTACPGSPGNFWFTSGVEVKTGDSDAW